MADQSPWRGDPLQLRVSLTDQEFAEVARRVGDPLTLTDVVSMHGDTVLTFTSTSRLLEGLLSIKAALLSAIDFAEANGLSHYAERRILHKLHQTFPELRDGA